MFITVQETTINHVTVYPDRARVLCQGSCEVTAGLHQLIIEDLPLTMEVDSVRVTGKGTARVRILSVDVANRYYEETPAAKVRELEQQIEQLEDETRVLEDNKAIWASQAQYLNGLRQATAEFARGLAIGRTKIQDQETLVQFLQEQDSQGREAVRQLNIQQRDLNRRLEKLRQELKHLRAARPRQRFQARVEVEVISDGTFQPELSYVVASAGWQPLYDVRLLESNGGHILDIRYIAQITQNTGQNWQGVALTVSTARPALNQRLPELNPWYLDVFTPRLAPQPVARAAGKAMAMTAAAEAPMEQMAPAPAAPPQFQADVAVATVQESGTAVSFHVPGQTDIPSDGSPHKTTVQQFSLVPRLDYLAIPRHTDAVYRRAKVTNSSPSPMLAGPAALFVGEEFIGRTQLEYAPSGGEVELLLGVEERITVERELMKREVDKRFLRDDRQLHYGYKITLKNLLKSNTRVELHDQMPVSRHEQIKVKLDYAKPEVSKKSDLNLFEWHLTLAAGQEQIVLYEYTVEHPRSLNVVGLRD